MEIKRVKQFQKLSSIYKMLPIDEYDFTYDLKNQGYPYVYVENLCR